MRLSVSFVALAAAAFTSAAPLKRTVAPGDITVLQFANVLEQLETQFYTQALSTFVEQDFITAGFSDAQIPIEQFTAIQIDESTHVTVIQSTLTSLGATPLTTCKFDFSSVLKDVSTMAATARVVENLGVAAYLGAARLITDPVILTAAASIVTVESRHQTILNIMEGGTSIPQAFDIPLTPPEVLAVASGFISGCDLGITANPSLTITNTETVTINTQLTFSSSAINGSTDGLFCQMLVGGAPFAVVLPYNQCVVPQGINGPVAIWVTSEGQPLLNNVRDQAADKIVAGPTMAFIDSSPQALEQLVRGGSSSASASASTTVQTISPAEASSIIASAGSTAAASATVVASASSTASATDSAASAVATGNNASSSMNMVLSPGGPNTYTGPSSDGSVTVIGWSS